MNKKTRRPDYKADQLLAVEFLKSFKTKTGRSKYVELLKEIRSRKRDVLEILMDDIFAFAGDLAFVRRIEANARRYAGVFADAADHPDLPQPDLTLTDSHSTLLRSRLMMSQTLDQQGASQEANPTVDTSGLPKELRRSYEISFRTRASQPAQSIRDVTSDQIGSLVKIKGIVTRITEVRPMIRVAVYTCDMCGAEIYQTIDAKTYTPLQECTSQECQGLKNKKPVYAQTKASKFTKFQECKLQELPEDVPVGNIPRSITIYCLGESTRKATCGDKVTVTGVWLPIPVTGFAAMRAGLTANTYVQAMNFEKEKKGYTVDVQDPKLLRKVKKAGEQDREIYDKLAKSIAPEIYGMEDVKKALMLLLVAGVTKEEEDGIKIRGDINVLLMGDPGVAKSQLLKYVSRVAPRAVYTTGKGSSGVGLTAAVLRDPITNEMVLEGGALVLADTGICCIDEFDKMEEADRTAIHEVMEQQTVSIAKAGITTTLNARTAILSAANPAYGRYNPKKTPEENINLPAALLSRFDLVFVLMDKADMDGDMALARHITHVHQHDRHPELDFKPFSADFMRAYVCHARQYEPTIPRSMTEYVTGAYIQMRQECLVEGMYDSRKIIPTARTLLSILRLSQALARIHFKKTVEVCHIEEAIRLMKESKLSAAQDSGAGSAQDVRDAVSRVYDAIIKHMSSRGIDQVLMADLDALLTTKGFTTEEIRDTLQKYNTLNVWQVSRDETLLRLVAH